MLSLAKSGTRRNKPKQPEEGWNVPETTSNKWNKDKPLSLWVTNDTDRYSMILDSINFHLTTPLTKGSEMGYN